MLWMTKWVYSDRFRSIDSDRMLPFCLSCLQHSWFLILDSWLVNPSFKPSLSMWSLRVCLCVCVYVTSWCFGFPPQSKVMQVGLRGDSKSPVGVTVSMNGLCVLDL